MINNLVELPINNVLIKKNNKINLICPFCSNNHVVKNGKNKDKQRYICQHCRKSFIKVVNTPIYISKKSVALWMEFLHYLCKQYSLREISKKLNISTSTAFYWRHKILDAIRENEDNVFLNGIIKCKSILFNESFKGNHSKSSFNMPRKAYKSYLTPLEFFRRRKVCVLLASDNSNNIINPIGNTTGKIKENDLINFLKKNILGRSSLISNNINLSSYKRLGSIFHLINYFSIKKYNDEKYNFDKVNATYCEIVYFFLHYRGVATKYLTNYLSLFTFIQRNKEIYCNCECPLFYRGKDAFYIKKYKERLSIIAS